MCLQHLAETDPNQALAKGYILIFGIALIGLIGVVLMVLVFVSRRMARRRLTQIEEDKAERRAAGSAGHRSAWQAGAERYVDHDKLPEDVPYDSEPDPTQDDLAEDETPPPGWEGEEPEQEEERDPYGLFDDKPYRDPDDEDDVDDEDDNDATDAWDIDGPDRPR